MPGKTPGVLSHDEEDLEAFHTDEEAENSEGQKEDMKTYLSKLNKRIDTLVDALKDLFYTSNRKATAHSP